MEAQPAVQSEAQTHWALAHPSRMRIMSVLRSAREPLDVEALAEALGLHHKPGRAHRQILLEAGWIRRRAQERTEAGRPRWLFEAVEAEEEPTHYRLLAPILASPIQSTQSDPPAAAQRA